MLNKLLFIRYLLFVVVVILLLSASTFIIVGTILSIHGMTEFIKHGFLPHGEVRPGLHLLEGLDAYMVSLLFIIFGLGIARLFIFHKESSELPSWLNIQGIKELKIMLWETILVTLVIFCVTSLIKDPSKSWETLIFPGVIFILSFALYLVRGKESH